MSVPHPLTALVAVRALITCDSRGVQADMEAKTAWIPKGIAPPTWLPGQKRNS